MYIYIYIYEIYIAKSLDAASKSVEIHDFCLEKQVELKFMLDKLFQDHFFKNGNNIRIIKI